METTEVGAATTRAPWGRRLRDAGLAALGGAGLAALFAHHGEGDRAAGVALSRTPGAWSTLWRAGHLPGATFVGAALALAAAVGILGLLGDSPLDLRGDEATWRPRGPDAGPWYRDERVLLPLLLAILYVPGAGAFGLWDPWETHYAEVAREMLARDDLITPWWGPEGWFLSKPALLPWLLALGMSAGTLFGNTFLPGDSGLGQEIFVRAPVVLLSLTALVAVQWCVGATCGRRAGFWSALVLGTTPFWSMVSHQAMTDVPFVALMTLSMAFAVRAITLDPDERVEAALMRVGPLRARVSPWHLTVALLTIVSLPQTLYLLTRPVLLTCPTPASAGCVEALRASRWGGVQFPIERFFAGSAGNSQSTSLAAGVPGTLPWEAHFSRVAFAVSAVQGVVWLALGAVVLLSLRRERRAQPLAFAMVYLFAGLSLLAKGPAGLGLPELTLALFILATRRWGLLRQLRLARGAAIFLLCAAPWYTAISVRLGREYFDRFVVHDLLARSLSGVHGDTGAAGYYVRQLAYGLFPWGALLPCALFLTPSRYERGGARGDVLTLARLWFAVSFALFSLMITRFHHYILPAVPAAAVLIGLSLSRDEAPRGRLAVIAGTLLVTRELVASLPGQPVGPARLLHLFTYDYARALPPLMDGFRPALLVAGLGAATALLLLGRRRSRRAGAGLLGAVGVLATAWALWVYLPALSAHRSQRGLFVAYERARGGGDAPLAAYALNWKGETFYSNGAVASFACGFPSCRSGAFEGWLTAHRGGRVFVLTERGRLATVRSLATRDGGTSRVLTTERDNQHFALVEVRP